MFFLFLINLGSLGEQKELVLFTTLSLLNVVICSIISLKVREVYGE